MTELAELDRRIAAIEIAIAAAATGDFDVRLEIAQDDELSSVESSINVMLESLQALFEENRRKHAEIELSLATITEQRAAIRELSTPVSRSGTTCSSCRSWAPSTSRAAPTS